MLGGNPVAGFHVLQGVEEVKLGTLWYVSWFIIPMVFIAGLLALPTG